jgi:hypothetical protein
MPFLISGSRRGGRLATIAGVLALCGSAAPAAQAANVGNPTNCTPNPTLTQAFAPFGDLGQYTPVDNAGLEDGTTGWTVGGGASVVADNEPWNVGADDGTSALDLPHGSSAVTAPICIDQTYPYFRFFAKKLNANNDGLRIDVLYLDSKGKVVQTKPVTYTTTAADWQPSGTVNIGVFTAKSDVTAAPVAFRFTPTGAQGHFEIDDVFVDPWCRR